MAKHNAVETHLYCPRCGTVHTIFRKANKQKEMGHYKMFYCYVCKTKHNHIELKDKDLSMVDIEKIIEKMKKEGRY